MPRVDILVPAYQEAAYVQGFIRSVQAQTYTDWSLILCDDGSTDGTAEAIEPFLEDARIRLIRLEDNLIGPQGKGWPAMYNRHLLPAASGELLCHVGADDLMVPDRLEAQVAAFDQDPKLDLCHTAARHINAKAHLLNGTYAGRPYHQRNVLRLLFAYNWIAFPTVMMRRDCFDRIGPCKDSSWSVYDYDFWLRGAGRLRYRYIPDYFTFCRVGDNFSWSHEGKIAAQAKTYEVRHENRTLVTIQELFPEVNDVGTQEAEMAAYVEMGNLWMAGNCPDPEMALREYQSANHIKEDHPIVCHNAAIAALAIGSNEAALKTLDDLADKDDDSNRSRIIAKGLLRGRHQLKSARSICPELYDRPLPAGTWRSDGSVADGDGHRGNGHAIAAFFKADGDRTVRLDYPLKAGDLVVDVGGYQGDFTAAMVERYGVRAIIFEPVAAFAESIRQRFATAQTAVDVRQEALGVEDGETTIIVDGDVSRADPSGTETARVVSVVDFLNSVGNVDLLKLNVEGAEYDILNAILDAGLMRKIRFLQVQFHQTDESEAKRAEIRDRLGDSHHVMWDFPFVWESWERKVAVPEVAHA